MNLNCDNLDLFLVAKNNNLALQSSAQDYSLRAYYSGLGLTAQNDDKNLSATTNYSLSTGAKDNSTTAQSNYSLFSEANDYVLVSETGKRLVVSPGYKRLIDSIGNYLVSDSGKKLVTNKTRQISSLTYQATAKDMDLQDANR